MLVAFLGYGQMWGADESVDFSAQGYTNQQAITSYSGTNFSIAFDKGTNNNAPKYYTSGTAIRVYGANYFTVSSTTKTITKIELAFGSSDGSNAITTDVETYENGTWIGSATSVKFTIGGTSGNRRLRGVSVTYAGGKQDAGLAYAAADAQKLVKVGAAFTAPTLSNDNNLTVTYASSDATVATVNSSTGAVTINNKAGKAVITASSVETTNFNAGEASYTIFVAAQAGTEADPLTEASAKALIDLGCTVTAHVNGVVQSASYNSTYFNYSITLANGFQFYRLKDLNNANFSNGYIKINDELTAVGALKKYNSTYELDEGCYLTNYVEYTEPLTSIANDKDHPYSVAQALAYAAAPTTYDLADHVYIQGVVYSVKNFNSNNGTYDIYIKDAGTSEDDGKFEFYKCAGLYDADLDAVVPFEEGDVQEGDEVIGYGVMTYYSGGQIWEFGQPNQLVSLNRPEVAVTGIEMTESTAEVEVGSTVTLHASVDPGNATDQGIVWSVTSGSDKASVDENGVVTGTAAGEAVIRAASHEDASIYEECTVTVTAVDPTVHHVTFIAGTDQSDETSITKDGITISATTFNNDNYYQCYSGEAMTVSSTVGNITKIEFTCTTEGTAKYGPGNWDFTGYSYSGANGSWTGSAETVEFGNASQQVRMTLITVTYKEDNREAAGLAWNPAEDIEITVNDAFSAPALLNPNNIAANEITITSDNTELATVTAGVVSLVANATGTAKITATFAGNDNYKPATISYNITVNEASLDNVTFDSSEDHAESGETTITKGGFTLSFTSGSMDGTQAEYRLYKSQTMTLSSTDYKIKKIEFTCTSGNPISGFADATGLDKDNNEWTGESNTVELTASNAQVRMTKIKVFYVDDTRAAAGLAWDPADDIELTVGDALPAPTLLNPNSIDAAEITIESSKTTVATVSEGVVSLVENATGTTTITATFAGNDTYKPATISYTIKVNPAYAIYVSPSLNVNFGSVEQDAVVADKKVTVTFTNVPAATLTLEGAGASAFTISPADAMTASGDITISASSANLGTFAATLTISDDDNNAESKVVNLSITVNEPVIAETPVSTTSKWVPATAIEDGMQVLITGVKADVTYAMGAASSNSNNRTSVAGSLDEGVFTPGENTMPFTLVATGAANTYYIKTSNNQYLYNASSSTKSYLKTKAEQEEVSWTIELDGDNNAVITSVENNNRQIMRFNPNGGNDPLFNCYASGQNDIKLYVPKPVTPPTPVYTEVRSGLEEGRHYTVCLEKNVTAVKGATFWSLTYKNSENTAAYLVEEFAPYVAGKPYIFQATDDNEGKLEVVYEGDAVGAPVENGALRGTFNYMDADALAGVEGTVYMLFNNELRPIGTNNHLDAHRAYVRYDLLQAVNAAPARPGHRVKSMPMQPNTATDIDILNASEVPVKVLIDGQIFILRGEKMYDTTGRLVK